MDQSLHDHQTAVPNPSCRFCRPDIESRVVAEFQTVWAFKDRYPVTRGHLLVAPKRHTPDWFSMTANERRDADCLIRRLKDEIEKSDGAVGGFNIGINCGKCAGQTIFHAHIHLIPRRPGDTENPTGGVRGVIPDKMAYEAAV